jgi:hypothetical protein
MNEIAVIDQAEIEKAIAKVESLTNLFTSETTVDNATLKKETSLELAKISKLLDSKRQDAVKPALEEQRRINDAYKPVITKLDTISRGLINQVADYVRIEERKEAERKAIEAKAQAEALIEGKTVLPEPIRPVSPNVKVSTTKVWVYEVVDQLQIPRQFLSPDAVKIQNSIKAGARFIPGLKISQQERVGRR